MCMVAIIYVAHINFLCTYCGKVFSYSLVFPYLVVRFVQAFDNVSKFNDRSYASTFWAVEAGAQVGYPKKNCFQYIQYCGHHEMPMVLNLSDLLVHRVH